MVVSKYPVKAARARIARRKLNKEMLWDARTKYTKVV
jgi:hypothetical protein